MKSMSRSRGLLAVLAASCISSSALAASVAEVEPNHPISSPQLLRTTDTTVQINGELSGFLPEGDVDFYSFRARAGDVLTVDIDDGFTGFGVSESVNTIIAIFGPGPDFEILVMNDNAIIDEGSMSVFDARIENFVVPATGVYIVGVTSAPRSFLHGGTTNPSPIVDGGTYVLNISGIEPAMRTVGLEIKPGDKSIKPLNPKSRGKIPVAILGSRDFNPLDIDTDSLTFGSTGEERSLHRCAWHGRDVNADGQLDLVCHFYNERAGFQWTDESGMLKGKTRDGEAFEARGWLKVVPAQLESGVIRKKRRR